MIYLNYGGDYVGRTPGRYYAGAPTATKNPPPALGRSLTSASHARRLWLYYLNNRLQHQPLPATTDSTGYYPGGSCTADTKDVQEFTAGYWYDFYRVTRPRTSAHAVRLALRHWSAQRFPVTGTRRRQRQGHRQHVLDLLPVLPAVRQPTISIKRAPTRVPFSLCSDLSRPQPSADCHTRLEASCQNPSSVCIT